MKRFLFTVVLIITLLGFEACGGSYAAETRVVTALDGSRIAIPSYPKRIACFYAPAYDKVVMLSKGDRVALIPNFTTPWAYKFYPELKGVSTTAFNAIPDVERLLKLKVDLVFYPKGHVDISKVTQAGIAAVCPFNDKFTPSTMAEYATELKRQILFFGEILGSDARVRAMKYGNYLDDITARITAITSRIPEADKPRVYYGKVVDLCATQGGNTIMRWYTELAGGIYLPKQMTKYFAEVNLEKVMAWDPDIVLLGMNGSFNTSMEASGIQTLRASKTGKVYKVPAGIFYWDMTSCETALLPLFLGKKFHPALFKDWDIVKEMQRFYGEIYDIKMTRADAERILNGQPPL